MTDNAAKENAPKEDTKNVTILDWMADDYTMEITPGIKFDPEKEYTFELTDIQRKREIKDDKEKNSLVLSFTEEESGVVIRQFHNINPKATKNADAPERSASLVKLAAALGYETNIGDKKFHPKHFLRMGMKIICHVVDQIDFKTKKPSGFSEIDITSIRPAGKKAQQPLATVDPGDVAKWQGEIIAGKFATSEKFMQNLASKGRFTEIAPFMEAVKSEKITFG